ncbi:MAG: VOC family protein, partial [Anaerolineae bacterium]|nr:VOC family protein [Anaerolineae bacterium]
MTTSPRIDQQITFLYTLDLATTAQFYEGTMGFPLVLDRGGCRIYRVIGEAYLGFCERASAPNAPKGILFTLVTDEVDAWYERLAAAGGPAGKLVDDPPVVNETYGIYHFFARDPNGYV